MYALKFADLGWTICRFVGFALRVFVGSGQPAQAQLHVWADSSGLVLNGGIANAMPENGGEAFLLGCITLEKICF